MLSSTFKVTYELCVRVPLLPDVMLVSDPDMFLLLWLH